VTASIVVGGGPYGVAVSPTASALLGGQAWELVADAGLARGTFATSVLGEFDGDLYLLGSQVETMMDQLTASIEHIRNGRIKALAVTSRTRSPLLPNVPTLDESGVPGYEATTFTGIFAPAGVPAAVADKLGSALHRALSNETVRERYRSMGVDIMDMNRAEFSAYVRTDFEKWKTIAREGHIEVE